MQVLATLLSLIVDAVFSWARMFAALAISIALAIIFGVWAAVSRGAERIILPIMDILQTLPILAFFPVVLVVFAPETVTGMENLAGVNAAVIFLIVTSMVWNIIFGVYEAVITIPVEFLELANLYKMGIIEKLRKIFIPASMPRIVQQSILSWSIGLFYLVTSEIFSYGTTSCCSVKRGIGAFLVQYSPTVSASNWPPYLLGLAVFIVFVVLTRLLFFKPLESYSTRYTRTTAKAPTMLARPSSFVNWFTRNVVAKPITTIRGFAVRGIPERAGSTSEKKRQKKPDISTAQKGSHVKWPYYIAALAVLLAIFVSLFASNWIFISYESQVLLAIAFSFARVWIAFLVVAAIALPLCAYLVFMTRHTSKYLLLFQVLSSIPGTVLLPAIAAAFAPLPFHAELVAFVIFLLAGIWYPIFSIMGSTRTIPASILEVKSLFKVRGIEAWKKFYIKAMLPGFITGALTGVAAEWNASIVAECFTTNGIGTGTSISCVGTGIGKLLDASAAAGNTYLMLVALLNLVVMIIVINTLVWKRSYRNIAKLYGQ
ncbi:MAG: ABC transporter permease subunit [Candidatus Micrarchaeaceae archaeon]